MQPTGSWAAYFSVTKRRTPLVTYSVASERVPPARDTFWLPRQRERSHRILREHKQECGQPLIPQRGVQIDHPPPVVIREFRNHDRWHVLHAEHPRCVQVLQRCPDRPGMRAPTRVPHILVQLPRLAQRKIEPVLPLPIQRLVLRIGHARLPAVALVDPASPGAFAWCSPHVRVCTFPRQRTPRLPPRSRARPRTASGCALLKLNPIACHDQLPTFQLLGTIRD